MDKIIGKQDKNYKNYILEKIQQFNNNGKKTIVYFCDSYYPVIDGVVKVLENYALTLSNTFNVVLVVPKHRKTTVIEKTDFLVIGSSSLFIKFVNYSLATPKFDRFLKKALKELKADIIHAHSPFTMGKLAAKTAKKKNVPFVMTLHSQFKQDFMRYTKSKFITSILMHFIMKVFNKSTEVWTMHEKTKSILIDYGYKGKIHLVPNATDFYVENLSKNKEQLSEQVDIKYNLQKDIKCFLFVGRLIAQKNVYFIVDALKILKDKGVKFKMFFVGNGPDGHSLKKHVINCGLENDIIFTGRIDDREELASYYARSDLFLFPSVYDASSLVQIEAAALYTPAVLLKDTATALTVADKVNGYISEQSVQDYAQTIMNAISNEEELKKISNCAYEQLYVTWKMLKDKIQNRYQLLIKEKEQNK